MVENLRSNSRTPVRGRGTPRPESDETFTEMRASRGPAGVAAVALLAGWMFAIAQMAMAGSFTPNPLLPWRAAASVVIGASAMEATGPVAALIVGVVNHIILSLVFGALYVLGSERVLPRTWQTGRWRWAFTGAAFGFVLYLVNFQLIARGLYPWFLEFNQPLQAALHTFVYGLPLGLMVAALEARLPDFAHRRA